ncbi:LOW QUALITY PROTEIN: erythroblast NAD(P)(+)--arginine ADP-ribosyltransferase-like [Pterocles gutturalis]
MEHLALGLVLLAGTLATGSPLHRRDLDPVRMMALDMAPTAFEDQYRGCSRMMEEELRELNRHRFANNRVYAEAWTHAAAEWWNGTPRPPVLRQEQAITLLAYTQHGPLYQGFNAALREAGRSRGEYLGTYRFKALLLLSEALRTRDTRPRRCHQVYRGVGIRFSAWPRQPVRFGHFTSTSLQKERALSSARDTVFSVETCFGVPIRDFSFFPEEEEVLIPPLEGEVTNITRDGDGVLIQLRSRAALSTYNCELVKGDVPTEGQSLHNAGVLGTGSGGWPCPASPAGNGKS